MITRTFSGSLIFLEIIRFENVSIYSTRAIVFEGSFSKMIFVLGVNVPFLTISIAGFSFKKNLFPIEISITLCFQFSLVGLIVNVTFYPRAISLAVAVCPFLLTLKWSLIFTSLISLFLFSLWLFFFPFLFIEEILNANNAIWLSHDGHMMLYASFNDSLVQEQHFAWYGTTNPGNPNAGHHPTANLYPEIRSLR